MKTVLLGGDNKKEVMGPRERSLAAGRLALVPVGLAGVAPPLAVPGKG